MKTNTLALMVMESLDGINPFFPEAAERPTEAPNATIGKIVYDRELVMDSRKQLHNILIRLQKKETTT